MSQCVKPREEDYLDFIIFSPMIVLSPKERELLKLICDDYKNAEVADELGYGTRYVEKLKAALLKKTTPVPVSAC